LNGPDQIFAGMLAKRLQMVGRERVVNVVCALKAHRQVLDVPVVCRLCHKPCVHGPKRRLTAGTQSGQHQQTGGENRPFQNRFGSISAGFVQFSEFAVFHVSSGSCCRCQPGDLSFQLNFHVISNPPAVSG